MPVKASTVAVRAIATDNLTSANVRRIVLREGMVGAINGVGLETEPGEAEDPDDRFSRLYRSIPCGDSVRFRYVRDGLEATARFVIEGS